MIRILPFWSYIAVDAKSHKMFLICVNILSIYLVHALLCELEFPQNAVIFSKTVLAGLLN
jgi:hypothetical protein